MKLRINSCGISDCPPSWHWITAPHGFPDHDLWVVFRGRGKIGPTSAGKDAAIRVHEGAALLLEPNTQYIAEHEPNYPLYVIHVHFDFLDDDGNRITPRKTEARALADPSLMRTMLLRTVSLYHSNKTEAAHEFLRAVLTEFELSEPLQSADADKHWQHIINEISAEADAGGIIPTLADYADRYSYSERYIGKMFVRLRGISFSDYIRNARINKAKTLLLHTDAPISVIAEETGFYDACHFTKTFRAVVGVPPLVYRKHSGDLSCNIQKH